MDLIGARELLNSCPSTRIRRCHVRRSSSRNARLTSERTTRVWGTPLCRKELRRSSHRACESFKLSSTRLSLSAARHGCRPSSVAFLPSKRVFVCRSSRSPAGFTSRSLDAGSKVNRGASISSTTRCKRAVASTDRSF